MNKLNFKYLETEDLKHEVEVEVKEFENDWFNVAEFFIEGKQVGLLQKLWSFDACRRFTRFMPSEIIESYACELFRKKNNIENFWFLYINCDHISEHYYYSLITTLINYTKKYMDEIEDFFIVFENRTPTYDSKKDFVKVIKEIKNFDVLENNERMIHYLLKDNPDKKFIMFFYRDPNLKELLNY